MYNLKVQKCPETEIVLVQAVRIQIPIRINQVDVLKVKRCLENLEIHQIEEKVAAADRIPANGLTTVQDLIQENGKNPEVTPEDINLNMIENTEIDQEIFPQFLKDTVDAEEMALIADTAVDDLILERSFQNDGDVLVAQALEIRILVTDQDEEREGHIHQAILRIQSQDQEV